MARDSNDNILGLTPAPSEVSPIKHIDLTLWRTDRSLTQDERQLVDEARMRQLAIDIIGSQTRFALTKISEMHEHASRTFDETCNLIVETKEQPERNEQHQLCIDQFSDHQIRLCAQHSLAMLEVGATAIGTELQRSPYPPPDSGANRPAGFLQRLLRG